MTQRFFFSLGFVLFDDLVFPDGQTHMAVLGGGSIHAAMGMRIWEDAIGLVVSAGTDFTENAKADMEQFFDLSGLLVKDAPTPRAWQLYENDGERREVFRTSVSEMYAIAPRPEDFPPAYANARGAHVYAEYPDPLWDWIEHLRANDCGIILWEPLVRYCLPENRSEIKNLMSSVDVVVLSLPESQRLTELEDPREIVKQFLADGAKTVALRMGMRGSLVADANGEIHHIPIYPVEEVVDVTGAGNAYYGGFLVGLEKTGDILQAGLYGTVSASLVVENMGALIPLEGLKDEAERRLEEMREQVLGTGNQ